MVSYPKTAALPPYRVQCVNGEFRILSTRNSQKYTCSKLTRIAIKTKVTLLNRFRMTYLQFVERCRLCVTLQRSQILKLHRSLLSPPAEWELGRR